MAPRCCNLLSLLFPTLLAPLVAATPALAAGWHYYDPECPLALGPGPTGGKSMKFVAMQPRKNIDRVCDALPETGATVIALDAPDPELREMIWDIRIVRDDGRDAGEPAAVDMVRALPPQKHRNGMVNFDHQFTEAGKYVLFVKMTSDDGATTYTGSHRFTVGLLDNAEFYTYLFFGAFVVAVAGGVGWAAHRRRAG